MSVDIVTEPVTIPYGKGARTVAAEATDVPGLVVTPEMRGESFTGDFCITHRPSGHVIPIGRAFGGDLYTARRVAVELGKLPIDWALPKDDLAVALNGYGDAIKAAIKTGRWPYTGDATTPDGPLQLGDYPRAAGEATAQTMAASAVRSGLQRYADNWELMGYLREDTTARERYLASVQAMLAEYGLAKALRTIHSVNPEVADGVARDLWEAYSAGDSIGEELAEWGAEYGIPTAAADLDTGRVGPIVAAQTQELLARRLPYSGDTVQTLRQQIQSRAYEAQQRFLELTDEVVDRDKTVPWEKAAEFRIAMSAMVYGFMLLSVLSMLIEKHPEFAVPILTLVDDMGTNGETPYTSDLPWPPPLGLIGEDDTTPGIVPADETNETPEPSSDSTTG